MKNRRVCGDCTLCCLVLPIEEVNSIPNQLCDHCTTKCEIYDRRPDACKNFNCLWIEDVGMSNNLKPNKVNVIFEKITESVYLGNLNAQYLRSWENPYIIEYVDDLNKKGISVIFTSFTNSEKVFMVSDGRTNEDVLSEAMEIYNKEFGK